MSSPVSDLRPLSIGEMLDRAFTIAMRHLLSFTAIVAIVVLPQLVIGYLLAKGPFSVFTGALLNPDPASVPDPSKVFGAYANAAPYLLLLFGLLVFFVPLANAAVVSGVSRAYLGMPVRFGECYRDALPRWLSVITLALLWIVTVFVAFLTLALMIGMLGGGLAIIGGSMGTPGAVVAVILATALGIIMILLALELYLAAAFSFVGAVLERQPAGTAYATGFRRVFGEGQMWRSLGVAAAACGIGIGIEIVEAIIAAVAVGLTRSVLIEYVLLGIVNVFVYPFLFAVVAVCYYDVRIRREGFDLQLLAAQLGARSAPPTAPVA